MEAYIYKITNTVNSKVYIGQTRQSLRKRLNSHFCRKSNPVTVLNFAVLKYGVENFTWELLETITADSLKELREKLNEREVFYISKYDSTNKSKGYNIASGGNNSQVSEEARKRLSENMKGERNPNYKGKSRTEDTKRKSREAKLRNGFKLSEETILKMITTRKLNMNEEVRDRYRQPKLGDKNPMSGKSGSLSPVSIKVLQYTKDGVFVKEFVSATEAGKVTGISQKNISCCCTGLLKSAGGFIWIHKPPSI